MRVPQPLVESITGGDCVAFVGAGFSAPAVPQWRQLLADLASSLDVPSETASMIEGLLERGTNRDLEAAAQTLKDAIGEDALLDALRLRLGDPPHDPVMRRRLELLRGIPFRAVLTTNFDGLLVGRPPGRDAYLEVLRPTGHRWWDRRFWESGRPGASVVKLHGSVDPPSEVVFTRRDYRRRLYANPAYSTFLRSVMSTTTVLYLGFSFTDAYLNELRSEILALLDYRSGDRPVAYAVVNDASPAEASYSRQHEGIELLPFATRGGTDFSGFDTYLEDIHARTNPTLLLGGLIGGKRIIWVDPSERNNDFGMRFLHEAADTAGDRTSIVQLATADEALPVITDGANLVITHWGHGFMHDDSSTAEYLLGRVRAHDLRVPVVVFASGDHADENKERALRLGATSYEHTWEGLFQEVSRIFRPAAGPSHAESPDR